MKIRWRIERRVRNTLGYAIIKDVEQFGRTLTGFRDDEAALEGSRLAAAVALYAFYDMAEGETPTPEGIRLVAQDIATSEEWAGFTATEIRSFLTAGITDTEPDPPLPPDRLLVIPYVAAAYLVAGGHNDDEEWWHYLDRIEEALEATSPPTRSARRDPPT